MKIEPGMDINDMHRAGIEIELSGGEPYPPPEPKPSLEVCTDVDNSAEFIAHNGNDLRYCYKRGKWLAWSGHRWEWDEGSYTARKAELTVRSIRIDAKRKITEAYDIRDTDDHKKALAKAKRLMVHAKKSESLPRRRAMVDGAQHHLAIDSERLDSNDWTLGCNNGVVDLSTGILRAGDRNDFITKSTGIDFDATAECPTFEAFLREIMGGDGELVSFIQRFAGYCLTGSTREECLLLALGPTGSNGKSVLLGALEHVMGDYARAVGFDMILSNDKGRNKGPQLAELDGVRLITASEPNANKRLDEALVKRLTGRDRIEVEAKYERPRNITMRGKLVLACNSPPAFPRGGHSLNRRIRVVPFDVMIADEDQDKDLPKKLEAEAPGVLAWCVRGCLDWQATGLRPPEIVRKSEQDYAADADPLHDWFSSSVDDGPLFETALGTLHENYLRHCESAGITHPIGRKRFAQMIRERGFEIKRTKKERRVVGMSLTVDNC